MYCPVIIPIVTINPEESSDPKYYDYIDKNGNLEGLDAVIDKDLASAVLAREINAELLMILTSVDKVSKNFGRPDEEPIDCMTVSEAARLLDAKHFPPGSMGPKIKAALQFLSGGGKEVIITSYQNAGKALRGEAGTRVIPD